MPLAHFCLTFAQLNENISSLGVFGFMSGLQKEEKKKKSPQSIRRKGRSYKCTLTDIKREMIPGQLVSSFFPLRLVFYPGAE